MCRLSRVLSILMVCGTISAFSQEFDSVPVLQALDDAKVDHQRQIIQLKKNLEDALNQGIRSLVADDRFDEAGHLINQRKAFIEGFELPTSEIVAGELKRFIEARNSADVKLQSAFQDAIQTLTSNNKQKLADQLKSDLEAAFSGRTLSIAGKDDDPEMAIADREAEVAGTTTISPADVAELCDQLQREAARLETTAQQQVAIGAIEGKLADYLVDQEWVWEFVIDDVSIQESMGQRFGRFRLSANIDSAGSARFPTEVVLENRFLDPLAVGPGDKIIITGKPKVQFVRNAYEFGFQPYGFEMSTPWHCGIGNVMLSLSTWDLELVKKGNNKKNRANVENDLPAAQKRETNTESNSDRSIKAINDALTEFKARMDDRAAAETKVRKDAIYKAARQVLARKVGGKSLDLVFRIGQVVKVEKGTYKIFLSTCETETGNQILLSYPEYAEVDVNDSDALKITPTSNHRLEVHGTVEMENVDGQSARRVILWFDGDGIRLVLKNPKASVIKVDQ